MARHDVHGHACTCRLLAEAIGCRGDAVAYAYCRGVLQRRWAMVCNHGIGAPLPEASLPPCPEVGPLDSIKAILIGNR